jgi:serine/threonine protein kinase/Tol biopolymer transport system component
MTLASGAKLGPYEVQSPLGAGGMGEVYRARDTRLGRDVALKILPESLTRDNDRLHRFEQEARAVAALNHPNILAVFDIGQHNGSPFLVSELLEGETLRTVLDRGPLPQRKTIDYGVQIAQGLAAAHEKGIVHRDLKPENIFVSKDGRIKILDFGLAKLAQKASAAAAESDGVTLTSSHTAAGVVMGTASYMAPEQVRGEPADPRTDIFAFGAVLYEMLSGQRAFRRETPAETMTAVLREDPPELTDSPHPISPALDRIVRRCLEKNPEQRFQSAKDLSFALSALSGTDSSGVARIAKTSRRFPLVLSASIALAVIAASIVSWFIARHSAVAQRLQFAIPVTGEVSHMALSIDGSMLAFVVPDEQSGIPMIYLQRVGSPDARVLQGTEGASYPFWSPDGDYLAFFARGELQKIAVSGGPPQVLAKVWAARGGSWGRRDVILYEPDSGTAIWRVNPDGSGAAPVTDHVLAHDEQTHRWPVFLPDGNHFLFFAGNFAGSKDDRRSGIYASSLDGKEKTLVALAHSSFAIDSSHLFYADDDRHLVAVTLDTRTGKVSGNPLVIANSVAFQPSTYWAAVTASTNDTLIYNTSAGASLSVLTWMDRSGKQLGQLGEPAVQCNPALSPDGGRIAVDISDQKANNVDIWIESTGAAANSRFTFDPAEEVAGVWSRDGKILAYRSAGGSTGLGTLFVKSANGLERERAIMKIGSSDDIVPNSWSLSDQQVLCTHQSPSGYHLELVPSTGGNPTPFQKGPGNQTSGIISPDGKWVAYASDESGSWEIYVTTFPGAAGKWQVSRRGGTEPRWRGDGKEILYLAPAGMLTAVPVSTEGTFSTGTPTLLFQFHGRAAISSTDVFSYDVSRDGKRFLVNRYVKPERITPLTVVLHASSEQK